MFIELLTAIGIGTAALPSDASEPTPIIDYPGVQMKNKTNQ